MSWVTYQDDEVGRFHPEFEIIAVESLDELALNDKFEWSHHLRLPGSSGIVPDYVLRDKNSQEWILALEIKRTSRDIFSSRYQYQAKSYAEENRLRYRLGFPLYFGLTNLELTTIYAAKDGERPESCKIQNGFYESGRFSTHAENVHKANYKSHLKEIISFVVNTRTPTFEHIWPSVVDDLLQHSNDFEEEITEVNEPETPYWNEVRDYLSYMENDGAKTVFLLRCLMAEYLRGRLHFHGHPQNSRLIPLNLSNSNSAANSIASLAAIDFRLLLSGGGSQYLNLPSQTLELLQQYIEKIIAPTKDVANYATVRNDSPILIESFISLLYPDYLHDGRGKIPTDPELADILACLAIKNSTELVIDPCCGDGALILSAYERLRTLGANHDDSIDQIYGIEADTLAVRIASVRLAMTNPAMIKPTTGVNIEYMDMFTCSDKISGKDVILVNPPFRRYEEQEDVSFPLALRNHYRSSIEQIKNAPPSTLNGQPNLYNYFTEFIVESMSEGATIGIILDNKWYHNQYGVSLKQFILDHLNIIAIVEYPHNSFFRTHDIATSLLIARKKTAIAQVQDIKFIRSIGDPRSVDLNILSNAFHESGPFPLGWSCRLVQQAELTSKQSWKSFFSSEIYHDYRYENWPSLKEIFTNVRRGSLQKEEGGLKVFAFPFTLKDFGPKRSFKSDGRSFETVKGDSLTKEENIKLMGLAADIPNNYRGFALQNADDVNGYVLTKDDVTQKQCIEPPALRSKDVRANFMDSKRSEWTKFHDRALDQLLDNGPAKKYINAISRIVGLNKRVLDKEKLWVDLREPYAGELIIPRKTRAGHKVHVNPFPNSDSKRQLRISSNFLSFSGCTAIDTQSGLDAQTAVLLISAYLLSSFGQLQFEQLGNNREGALAMEEHHFEKLKVFDPRWISRARRQAIIDAFKALPFPIATNVSSNLQTRRNQLDALFAEEIISWQRSSGIEEGKIFEKDLFLDEIHQSLDEWIIARQP